MGIRAVILVVLALFIAIPVALAQSGPILLENGTTQSDVPGPMVAFPDGTELMVEPNKGPVQGIISKRTEAIEAGETRVYINGLIAIQTMDGWVAAEVPFSFDATGTAFEDAELQQGWRIVLERPE